MNYDEFLNETAREMKPSGIRKFFDVVKEIKGAISLGVGEPDFITPWSIRDAAIRSIQKGRTQYTSNSGMKELREAIARYLKERFSLEFGVANILVTIGASEPASFAGLKGADGVRRAVSIRVPDGVEIDGKEVEIPRFDFKAGKKLFEGKTMQLQDKDILIMEGIHALNPAMIPDVDSSKVFRVYVSALTSLSLDENNNISTSDNRMLRRMIRDNRTRGVNPESTIMRWQSVRRGENRNIFPFQENSDAIFNSAHIFELPVLKYYAEPLLRRIAPNSPAYTEATRILKFLSYIVELSPQEIAAIPPTSILREFIAGQTL